MLKKNFPLLGYTTFGTNVTAKYFLEIYNFNDIARYRTDIKEEKTLILGNGSNILFLTNFDGLIIKLSNRTIKIIQDNKNNIKIRIGAGYIWSETLKFFINNKYYGLESLALIPGSIGGMIVQNAGAYGTEISQYVDSVYCIDIETFKQVCLKANECEFIYRSSLFSNNKNLLITEVDFNLNKIFHQSSVTDTIMDAIKTKWNKNPNAMDVYNMIKEIRKEKIPDYKKKGNAGCFFKNPIVEQNELARLKNINDKIVYYKTNNNKIKLSAGWLIESCGWKGKEFQGAQVSPLHASILTKNKESTGLQVYELFLKIQNNIENEWGITLHPEVIIV